MDRGGWRRRGVGWSEGGGYGGAVGMGRFLRKIRLLSELVVAA